MKSFDCESSSEGDEPTIHAISRGGVEPRQWLRVNSMPGWGWQGAVSIFTYYIFPGQLLNTIYNFGNH